MNTYQIILVVFVSVTSLLGLWWCMWHQDNGNFEENNDSIKILLGFCIYLVIAFCVYFYLGTL